MTSTESRPAYAVLSLREIRELYRIARANAQRRKARRDYACVVLRGSCADLPDDTGGTQFEIRTADSAPLLRLRR